MFRDYSADNLHHASPLFDDDPTFIFNPPVPEVITP